MRVLHLFHNKYTGYNWSIYCWDYVQLVTTESNVLLYLLPTSVQLCCWQADAWMFEWVVLYCAVLYIAACVDVNWNGIFRDRSLGSIPTWWQRCVFSVASKPCHPFFTTYADNIKCLCRCRQVRTDRYGFFTASICDCDHIVVRWSFIPTYLNSTHLHETSQP